MTEWSLSLPDYDLVLTCIVLGLNTAPGSAGLVADFPFCFQDTNKKLWGIK